MDHPKDIRYRYNRGCASFQNSDYKGAVASFSSVMRRTKEDDTRFRAAYNLGNTAFKQGDFTSASIFYKKALLIKPDSEDARYNLELALREEEKQAEQKKDKSRQGSGKSEDKEKQPQSGEKKEGQDRRDRDQDEKKNRGESEKKEEAGKGKDNRQDKGRQPEQDKPEDLSGELSPREAQPEDKEKAQDPAEARAMMDKKKAEALLDNIKENPAKFFRHQIPKDKRRGVKSGKNW
jgi:Ca-activated chloride channel family protein